MSINEEEYLQLEKEINIDDIDFSDLEEKYEADVGLDNYIIVDGAPVAPESKVPVLTKVLKKLFSTVGEIVDGDEGIYSFNTRHHKKLIQPLRNCMVRNWIKIIGCW